MLHGHAKGTALPFLVLAMTLFFISLAESQQPDPSARCKYQPDPDPAQIGPGSKNDTPYNFAYVSDFNTTEQKYRRRICDDSSKKNDSAEKRVRFDWPITGLNGFCPSGGTLSEETACAPQPDTGTGPLKYDLRELKTTTAYRLSSCKPPSGSLVSSLSGYVVVGAALRPVSLKFTSSHSGSEFSYGIANQSEIPVKVYWRAFSDFWKHRDPKQYDEVFGRLVDLGDISGSPDKRTVTINQKREAGWKFTLEGPEGAGGYSSVEIYGPEAPEKPEEADLAGVAALYLPVGPAQTKRPE